MNRSSLVFALLCALAVSTSATAGLYKVEVKVENLAPANSIAFAPLHVGFHGGTFDAFDNGGVATAPIISVAEGGSGSAWFPAFAAADPTATLGTIGGLLLPGAMATNSFMVDSMLNPFFTFASMVVPSNDFFIGNDTPTRFRLFDANGLAINEILQQADDIWDAGSEAFDPANAAFVGNNDLRTPQNGVVSFQFAELAGFNGLTTGAGYTFDSQLSALTDVYRISFTATAVPEPASIAAALVGIGGAFVAARIRRRK
ncbi:MAG: spondin domain-containing protein [Isosphaeraceae bacterium]|nr:spondin domain-containing protein [Isosphaeraceae bacterium]